MPGRCLAQARSVPRLLALVRAAWAALLVLVLVAAAPPAGSARAVTAEETVALTAAIARFDNAMRESRYADVIEVIPPRIIGAIAAKAGATQEQLRKSMLEQIDKAMAVVKIVSFGMDLKTGRHAELPDGTPYILIPTETRMQAEGVGNVRATSETLALLDDGKWYLLRVENPLHVAILRETYPEFAKVEFAKGTMEIQKK